MSQSDNVNELVGALAKAHLAFKEIKKTSSNPYFNSKYADLAEIIDCTAKALSENGLAIVQAPLGVGDDNKVRVETAIYHSSGQWMKHETCTFVAKNDAQAIGSATTYLRRYSLQAVLNVAADSDDDGNSAVGTTQKDRQSTSTDKSDKDGPALNPTQVRAFWSAVKAGSKSEAEVRSYLKDTLGIPDADKCPKTELAGKILKVNLDSAVQWAAKGSDLTQELKQSVEWTQASKRLWATAGDAGMVEKTVKDYAYKKFSVDSMKRLTPAQLNEVTSWIADAGTVPF